MNEYTSNASGSFTYENAIFTHFKRFENSNLFQNFFGGNSENIPINIASRIIPPKNIAKYPVFWPQNVPIISPLYPEKSPFCSHKKIPVISPLCPHYIPIISPFLPHFVTIIPRFCPQNFVMSRDLFPDSWLAEFCNGDIFGITNVQRDDISSTVLFEIISSVYYSFPLRFRFCQSLVSLRPHHQL